MSKIADDLRDIAAALKEVAGGVARVRDEGRASLDAAVTPAISDMPGGGGGGGGAPAGVPPIYGPSGGVVGGGSAIPRYPSGAPIGGPTGGSTISAGAGGGGGGGGKLLGGKTMTAGEELIAALKWAGLYPNPDYYTAAYLSQLLADYHAWLAKSRVGGSGGGGGGGGGGSFAAVDRNPGGIGLVGGAGDLRNSFAPGQSAAIETFKATSDAAGSAANSATETAQAAQAINDTLSRPSPQMDTLIEEFRAVRRSLDSNDNLRVRTGGI